MATTINNVVAINVGSVATGLSKTFTTTRALRVFDLKAYKDSVPVAGAAAALTVSNGATPILTVTTPNPPVINTVYRAGNEVAASTCDSAAMTVAAGGTVVFGCTTADTFNMTATAYPL